MVHEPLLGVVQVVSAPMDRTGTINAHNLAYCGVMEHLRYSQASRARARDNYRHIADLFVDKLESIPKRSRRDYGGAVLVVVKHRNVERLD